MALVTALKEKLDPNSTWLVMGYLDNPFDQCVSEMRTKVWTYYDWADKIEWVYGYPKHWKRKFNKICRGPEVSQFWRMWVREMLFDIRGNHFVPHWSCGRYPGQRYKANREARPQLIFKDDKYQYDL